MIILLQKVELELAQPAQLIVLVCQDGFDETLVPVDYKNNGQIRDDMLYDVLVAPMARGVFATLIMDCCHRLVGKRDFLL